SGDGGHVARFEQHGKCGCCREGGEALRRVRRSYRVSRRMSVCHHVTVHNRTPAATTDGAECTADQTEWYQMRWRNILRFVFNERLSHDEERNDNEIYTDERFDECDWRF